MKFSCPLYAVHSMAAARNFYETVLHQKLALDFGANVTYEGGFALQEGFSELVGFPEGRIQYRSHDGELYFETETLDEDVAGLQKANVEFLHGVKEYPWGQRVTRFFDPDGHIVELGESMCSVVLRFLGQGLSDEETAERTQHPLEFVQLCKSQRKS